MPPQAVATPRPAAPAAVGEAKAEQALVPSVQAVPSSHAPVEEKAIVLTGPVARLPVELDVSVPVREFRVRNLLAPSGAGFCAGVRQ